MKTKKQNQQLFYIGGGYNAFGKVEKELEENLVLVKLLFTNTGVSYQSNKYKIILKTYLQDINSNNVPDIKSRLEKEKIQLYEQVTKINNFLELLEKEVINEK